MLELGVGADLLRGLHGLYIALIAFFVCISLWFPEGWWRKAIGVGASLVVFGGPAYLRDRERDQTAELRKAGYVAAKALFEERCKSAGEKIYKTVENVDGVLLASDRGTFDLANFRNRDWPYAGFPGESSGSQYIMEFLYYNVPPHERYIRSLQATPGGTRGYRFVEVLEGTQEVRYSLRDPSSYLPRADPVEGYGKREATSGTTPRYAIVYENIADPLGRKNWIAGGRVSIVDQKTREVLAEFVRYAFDPGFGNTQGERSPWAFATQCPDRTDAGRAGHIRLFAEKVVRPIQGE